MQTTIFDHIPEATKKVLCYDCHSCMNKKAIQDNMVLCLGRLKAIPEGGCSCWSDGGDLAAMRRFSPPAGWLPKKWGGIE